MGSLLQDLRYATRTLLKAPAFTLVVVSTLALGIGANTAIFTLMDQVLLRSLPVRDPQQLMILNARGSNMGRIEGPYAFSYPMLKEFREELKSVSGILGRSSAAATLMVDNRSERVQTELVTGNYFELLGIAPAEGRLFNATDEETPDGHPVLVLSHSFWSRRFAANPSVVGKTVRINGMPMTVVGVAPRGFNGTEVGNPIDAFVPVMMRALMVPSAPRESLEDSRTMWLQLLARVPDGSEKQAEAEINTLFRRIRTEELKTIPIQSERFRKRFLETKVTFLPGYKGLSQLREQFSTPVLVLMGMVGLVLLIACANVANLLMARAPSRQREIAVRLALGASRGRIVSQLLVESFVLAVVGGALGVLLSIWAADLLLHALPFEGATRTFSATPDARVLLFTLGVSLLTGLLFGLVPALQTARPRLVPALKEEGGSVVSTGHVRLRKGLVVAQVVLSLLLLVGAGLFARSLWNLRSLDPGFRIDKLVTFSVDPSLSGYKPEASMAFFERLQDRLSQQAGVTSVSMSAIVPLTNNNWMSTVKVDGYPGKEGEDLNPNLNIVGPGYFKTMGIPILNGRDIQRADGATAPKVAVINETMAKYFFGSSNPIGRRFSLGNGPGTDIEIVGVARDGKNTDLRQEVKRTFYLPLAQAPEVSQMTMMVRVAQEPMSAEAIRQVVRQIDAVIPIFDVKTMEVVADESLFIERMIALLSACFGALAMVLAAVGLYGVMSYTVARRTREIGVRMALGAQPSGVVWLIMREVAVLALIGVAVGLPTAMAVGRLISSQLFGVSPNDPATLAGATLTLLTVALLAGYIPAGQATRVDPIKALRWE